MKDMNTAHISGSADFIQIPGGWPADQHGIPAVVNKQGVHLVHNGVMEGPCDSLQQICSSAIVYMVRWFGNNSMAEMQKGQGFRVCGLTIAV